MPNPAGYRLEDTLTAYETARGPVTYPDQYDFISPREEQAAAAWLFQNPQRLDLEQIGLALRHADPEVAPAAVTDLTETEQTLDLWRGLLQSDFRFDGQPVRVWTVCHPNRDLLAVRIESPLLADGRLAVSFILCSPPNSNYISGHRRPANSRLSRRLCPNRLERLPTQAKSWTPA